MFLLLDDAESFLNVQEAFCKKYNGKIMLQRVFVEKITDKAKTYFMIWLSNDMDGYLTRAQRLVAFRSPGAASAYLTQIGLSLTSTEISTYNFGNILPKIALLNKKPQHRHQVGATLNALDDMVRSLGYPFPAERTAETDLIQDKLFFGRNYPTVTPPGKIYIPRWRATELQTMTTMMRYGLRIWRTHLDVVA
jgi:hypothetical protein